MDVFELGPEEAVIMQDKNVQAEKANVRLILTNQNIIQVNKSLFGAEKSAQKYSLLDLKEINGKPNILIGKTATGSPQLELYFSYCEKYYSFHGLLVERKWASAIEKAYKSCLTEKKKRSAVKKMGPSVVKTKLEAAIKAITPPVKEPQTGTVKCPKCGAELIGEKKSQVQCEYCGALVTIK